MGIHPKQTKDLIIKVLRYLEPEIPFSEKAVDMLMFTAAAESLGGYYLTQVGGPARGIFQMEPATEHDIWENFLKYKPSLAVKIQRLRPDEETSADLQVSPLMSSMCYSVAMARCHYFRVREGLPRKQDPRGLTNIANYWKKHYNTVLGKGDVDEALRKYRDWAGDSE